MIPLYPHQIEDVRLIKANPYFMNASEQGSGKTRTAIEAAQQLFLDGEIDQMIVVAPAPLRTDVWYSEELGQLKQYLTVPSRVTEYQSKTRSWDINVTPGKKIFHVIVSNYEFVRQNPRLEPLIKLVDARRTFLVLDESSAVSNHEAKQTKACAHLRARSKRVLLMNGTPVDESPGNAYAQFRLLSPEVLGCKNWWQFRARYAVLGGFQGKQVIKWTNLADLSRRTAPYVVRHMKKDCLSYLPPKLPSVYMSVPMSTDVWRIYKEMRDDTIAWLDQNSMATAAQAGVRIMRLAQITSGFLGGIKDIETEKDIPTRDVGREKLDLLLDFVDKRLIEDKDFKLLVWSRFRAEVERTSNELKAKYPKVPVGVIWGGQKQDERSASITLLDPRSAPPGPALVVGTVMTGAMGLNLAAAHDVVYLSNDWSARIRSQSEERVHRPGQTFPVSYFEILATGPDGQKTVDHAILKAMKRKYEDASLTMEFWKNTLKDESPE